MKVAEYVVFNVNLTFKTSNNIDSYMDEIIKGCGH